MTLDVSRFEDVRFLAGTEESVSEEILKELHCLSEKIQSSVSAISSVVSDSAPCNVGARGLLSLKFPELCFTMWFSHQLNLMAGKVSTQKSTISTKNQARTIVSFFNNFPKQWALQATMMNIGKKVILLVTEGDTPRCSHYRILHILFAARMNLEAFKSLVQSDTSVMSIKQSFQFLDTIGSSTFWMKLGLISELLRPLKIEIGVLERTGLNLADVAQSVGRLFALLTHKHREAAHLFQAIPELLEDLLTLWE